MIDIPLPRLLNASGGTERTIMPITVSANLNITPLSYASMKLPRGESLPARGYVELYSSMGSLGIYRVRSPQDAYGEDITTAELEHAIVEVGDYLVLDKFDEMMAANTAMTTVFKHYRGTRWKLGSVSALGSGKIALQTDHDRVLEAMLSILNQKPDCMMSFDFSTSPWTVSIVSRGTSVTAEGRLSRNVNSAKVIYDDTEFCTRVYYEIPDTASDGSPTTKWTHIDSDTLSKYGIVERIVSTGTGNTADEALAIAKDYLDKHKEPRVSIEISAEELSSVTGETFDTFTIGKLCRLALVDYGVTVERTITGMSWSDVYDSPTDITVYLAEEEDTAITFLHDLDTKGGSGGSSSSGGGGGKKKQEDIWKEYYTRFEQTDYYFDLMAVRVDKNDNILQQAGLYIDANGVLQYAQDNENMIGSQFKVAADNITAVSKRVDENGEAISEASLRISGAEASIEANTKKINENTGAISEANLKIDGANANITLQASRLDTAENTLNSAKLEIDGANARITAVTEKADANGKILKQAGMSIDPETGFIAYASNQANMIGARFNVHEKGIDAVTTKTNANGDILKQAGLSIGEDGIIQYATNQKDMIGARFNVQANQISGVVQKTNEYGNIIKEAGLSIDEDGTLIYATNKATMLGSKIKAEADRIDLVVEGKGPNARIKAAEIVSSINNEDKTSSIRISADKVNLDGYVTASQLNAGIASFGSTLSDTFNSRQIGCVTLSAGTGRITTLYINDTQAVWRTTTIAGTTIHYLSY